MAAKSVCTATGENAPACLAAKAQCENKQVVVVKDAKAKCPAAVSVCTATGEANPACVAAKAQCVAGLQELYGKRDQEGNQGRAHHDEGEPDYMELYQRAGHVSLPCNAVTMVCAATQGPACDDAKAKCEAWKLTQA